MNVETNGEEAVRRPFVRSVKEEGDAGRAGDFSKAGERPHL